MKKQLVYVAFVLLLCLSGCESGTSRIWGWGDDEVIGARIGTLITENNEAGIMLEKQIEDCELVIGGIYALRYFPPTEFGNPFSFEFLPRIIEGRPYLGAKLDMDLEANNSVAGPMAGIIFEEVFFLEYQPLAYEPGSNSTNDLVRFGLWFPF